MRYPQLCRWNDTKLLHYRQVIHQDSAVGHLAPNQAINDNPFYTDTPARSRNAEKCPSMRTSPREASDDLISTSHRLIRNPVNIGECNAHHPDDLFQTLSSLPLPRKRIKLDKIDRDQFIGLLQPPLVDDPLQKPGDDCNVPRLISRHIPRLRHSHLLV